MPSNETPMRYTKDQLIEMETKFTYAFLTGCLQRRLCLPKFAEISKYFSAGLELDLALADWGASHPYTPNASDNQ